MIIKSQILFLRSILYLAAIVECGSITKAAERNGIKQANLSRMIKDLEKITGTPLFIRKSYGMVPTETALVLYRHALLLQENLQEIQSFKTQYALSRACVKLYKPDSLTFDFLQRFTECHIQLCDITDNFDVGVFYESPQHLSSDYQIGEYELYDTNITQKLWIAFLSNNPHACAVTDFIISQLFS